MSGFIFAVIFSRVAYGKVSGFVSIIYEQVETLRGFVTHFCRRFSWYELCGKNGVI